MQKQINQAVEIVRQTTGWHLAEKRRDALLKAGFRVGEITTKWNFGQVGSVSPDSSGFWIQVGYATGGRTKGGYGVNACPCVYVTLKKGK